MPATKITRTETGLIPLDQLGAWASATKARLDEAQELYEQEPTRAHAENLREAEEMHRMKSTAR
jgi:hypothetical protein